MSSSHLDGPSLGPPDDAERTIDRAILKGIHNLSAEDLDDLPFGAIRLDEDGTILFFNNYEARLTGRDPELVVDKNFFTEVAPCTNVREFAGHFRDGVRARDLYLVFPFRFDFKMQPRRVWVTLFYCEATKAAWVFVRDNQSAA